MDTDFVLLEYVGSNPTKTIGFTVFTKGVPLQVSPDFANRILAKSFGNKFRLVETAVVEKEVEPAIVVEEVVEEVKNEDVVEEVVTEELVEED